VQPVGSVSTVDTARYYRHVASQVECFNCGKRGHIVRIAANRKMAKGALPIPRPYYDARTVEHTSAISTPNIPRKAA